MARAWSFWYRDLGLDVPGAPNPLMVHALRRAAREFFARTRAWTEWLERQDATGVTTTDYDFNLPRGSNIVRLERVTVDGKPVDLAPFRTVEADWTNHDDAASGLISRDLRTFRLMGTFAAEQKVQVRASLMPSLISDSLPDDLADRYFEALTEGAKAYLLKKPRTEFYNIDLAAEARMQFEAAIGKHSAEAYRSHTGATPRAKVHWC